MTGFGTAALENEKISLNVQIKTVNGRFLDTRFRMPRQYGALENEMKRLIASKLSRGSVDIQVNRALSGQDSEVEVTTNVALARGWMKAAGGLAKELGLPLSLTTENFLRIPDVIAVSESAELESWERDAVLETLKKALAACVSERKREGEELGKILGSLLDQMDRFLLGVKKRKTQLDGDLKERLKERLKNIDPAVQVDPNRLAQEVVILLDRADIAEELARADAHVGAYRKALNETGAMGKKLDFYTQELHREVNTMGSKTQSLDVTLDIIEAKTCVERMREQVQNVE